MDDKGKPKFTLERILSDAPSHQAPVPLDVVIDRTAKFKGLIEVVERK